MPTQFRPLLLLSGAAVVLFSGTAPAAPVGRPCVVLTDLAGDARPYGPGLPTAPELDLLEARMSADAKTLTVTMRFTPGDAAEPTTGQVWSLGFGDGERAVKLNATRGPDGAGFAAYGGSDDFPNKPWLGEISGRLDVAAGTVTMAAPLAQVGLRPTSTYRHVEMYSAQGLATSGAPLDGTPLSSSGPGGQQSNTFGADDSAAQGRRSLAERCR